MWGWLTSMSSEKKRREKDRKSEERETSFWKVIHVSQPHGFFLAKLLVMDSDGLPAHWAVSTVAAIPRQTDAKIRALCLQCFVFHLYLYNQKKILCFLFLLLLLSIIYYFVKTKGKKKRNKSPNISISYREKQNHRLQKCFLL